MAPGEGCAPGGSLESVVVLCIARFIHYFEWSLADGAPVGLHEFLGSSSTVCTSPRLCFDGLASVSL